VLERGEQRDADRVRPGTEAAALASSELRRDLQAAGASADIRIGEGDPAEVILSVARDEGCALIVTGVARNETLGRFSLGATVDQLLRAADVPVLVVTARARAEYRRVVVAIDLSSASQGALQVAAAWFPTQRLAVVHAYQAPGSYAVGDVAQHREDYAAVARADAEQFLVSSGLSDEARARVELHVEAGHPAQTVRELVQREAADLVVLGTRGYGAFVEFFMTSTAKRIAMGLSCDALVVRD
jgi:nucleotide-binding universal stress UspA family protein